MTAVTQGRPLVVGMQGELVVHVQGRITSLDKQTVTIAGWTLPIRLGDGVRTVSTRWPEEDCTRPHCDDDLCDCEPECDCEVRACRVVNRGGR